MESIIIQYTDNDILDILKTTLELENFNVYAVLEADENFLKIIDEVRPHVIILDYRLDGQACIAICNEIKVSYPYLPVIAISCNSNIAQIYNQYGFDGYISKPFELEDLYG